MEYSTWRKRSSPGNTSALSGGKAFTAFRLASKYLSCPSTSIPVDTGTTGETGDVNADLSWTIQSTLC